MQPKLAVVNAGVNSNFGGDMPCANKIFEVSSSVQAKKEQNR
jgi:hypothetical protein